MISRPPASGASLALVMALVTIPQCNDVFTCAGGFFQVKRLQLLYVFHVYRGLYGDRTIQIECQRFRGRHDVVCVSVLSVDKSRLENRLPILMFLNTAVM
jgi:hypothetical protein